jgi:hypothetical protein
MADKKYPNSGLPIRKSSDFLPQTFRSESNDKFLSGVFDPMVQPGTVDKLTGFLGRRYGKTYNGKDVYLDSDNTLRSRYQLEPGVTIEKDQKVEKFYDYLDFKNILTFFGNINERDDNITYQEHYSWNPPIDWDKFLNYREYYWLPSGPPTINIFGQTQDVQSTYKVRQGTQSTWIFTPDAVTNNPIITLYRGQSYTFDINSPGEGFTLRTNYDTGSLTYDPNKTYFPGELAVFDGKLFRAKVEISPADGSSIDIDSQDWELIDSTASNQSLDYNQGVTGNGVEVGELTFTVPLNSPDVLYYQSNIDPNRLGRFLIADIDSNTFLEVEKDIIGKKDYTSSNGIKLSNGMLLEFTGTVVPEKYSTGVWLVEGVGKEISLTNFSDLVPPSIASDSPEILFDNQGFDTQPYDDASQYPGNKDYLTINRGSKDRNPWSRYNRWFHRSVIDQAYKLRNSDFPAPENARAKRPIIEFHPNIQLFNHGIIAKETVDYVDTFTQDVFSTIEGSSGYSIDGEFLFEGARILVTADTDNLANNKIYQVKFVTHNGVRQISLVETQDTDSIKGECILVRRGTTNAGKMYDFDGSIWSLSQEKTKINQSPLFDIFDENDISLSDTETYPVSNFIGNKIISYRLGNGPNDSELGFPLTYLNINNVGDIVFDWNIDNDVFEYTTNQQVVTDKINTGFYKINGLLDNGWLQTDKKYLQPIVDTFVFQEASSTATLNTVEWDKLTSNAKINFYLNGQRFTESYTRSSNEFTWNKTFSKDDVLYIKIVDNIEPDQGYYEIPVGLEKNPLNELMQTFTLGQASDHVVTSLEFDSRFEGALPGKSNLRDLSDFQKHAKRFLKHSGLTPSAIAMLVDKEYNLIKSLQFSKQQYLNYKDNFIKRASEIDFIENTAEMVDQIIIELSKTKTTKSPFADSDMIGSGAYSSNEYIVEDTGIKTFSLLEKFDLETLSRRAVYIYKNGQQLLYGSEYTLNSTFGYVELLVDLQEGDKILINEYNSTASSHMPPTPTAMGLYKKYTPQKFLDDTYLEPREVIQGHDGSITQAYGDFRDDLLLELEYRIYNNIKNPYDETVFDMDKNLGGYYKSGLFSKNELDVIINMDFLKWIANTNIGYTLNTYLTENEPFTYTYSNMTGPNKDENLPGWWRGAYNYYYDTDRPHRCPWEMLGFSEKPNWWDDEYGEAPYTSGNLILWEDLEAGIIRHGSRQGINERYARPGLMRHLPVDADGLLVDPLTSGLATNFTFVNNKGPFKLGDVSPAEYAYRSSVEYPFAVVIALCLLRPFEYIVANFDKSQTTRNAVNQIVDKNTKVFITKNELNFPVTGSKQVSGLSFYLASYTKYLGKSIDDLQTFVRNINVRLTSRLSGFVDKDQQKFLLDSKSPASASSSIFVPPENYDIIFNASAPISSITYSGVIVEKDEKGWVLNGYDSLNPYFKYYEPYVGQKDPTITVGGVSETFVVWSENQTYNNGAIVEYRNDYYRAKETHTSSDTFETNRWMKLPNLPIKNGVTAQRARNFNKFNVRRLSYGSLLTTIQDVVNFLVGYQEYLIDQGFVFNNYDSQNQVVQDFVTSAKEFMFWTSHNWAIGSLITLSPGAEKLTVLKNVGVADNVLDGFYDYNVLKDNGEPLDPRNIDVKRDFQSFTINTFNTTAGIYYLKVNYVLKEHVAVFDDRTVFNDVIFDKNTGYRQERIKTVGFRTTDWDGDYTSPGFIFDNVNIQPWTSFTDYRLGDIVSYKSENYTSKFNHTSEVEFNNNNWTVLDSNPEKQLVPNYDYRINQIEDYFAVDSQGLGQSQRELARHTVGYQTRDYLQNLAEDEVTQFKLYQGFIREKGTFNSITKIFDKLSRVGRDTVNLKEEWAFRVGQFGGTDQSDIYEIRLNTDNFKINPQPLLVTSSKGEGHVDRYYRIDKSDFDFGPVPYTKDIVYKSSNTPPLKTAGYVKLGQTEFTFKNRDDILALDINDVTDNDHFWITFDKQSWTVLRVNFQYELRITEVSTQDKEVTITFDRRHNLEVGDIVGFTTLGDLNKFHKIEKQSVFTISFTVEKAPSDTGFEPSSKSYPLLFTEARFANYESIAADTVALLPRGSKIFVDDYNGKWEVVEKTQTYTPKKITNFGVSDPSGVGQKTAYAETHRQILVGIPGAGYTVAYLEQSNGLEVKQIIEPLEGFQSAVIGTFGQEIALSPDDQWLAIGSPKASGIPTKYRGIFDITSNYAPGDIVMHDGQLWESLVDHVGDGSTINVYSNEWKIVKNIPALESGSNVGYSEQGLVSLYTWSANQWNYHSSFTSPRPDQDSLFGTQIKIVKDNSAYRMIVSAPGAQENKGRVYIYEYDQTDGWILEYNDKFKGPYRPGGTFASNEMIAGRTYTIVSSGTSQFIDAGAQTNLAGTEFVATQSVEGTGTVSETPFYPKGSIVYYLNNLWEALEDNYGDGSTISVESNQWLQLDEINTGASLPISAGINDDGSTLASGILSQGQLAELVKAGDKFGSQVATNYSGSIIAISAPEADGQYFPNFKGTWRPYTEYIEGDVVRYQGGYHILQDTRYEIQSSEFNKGYTYTITEVGTTDWNVVAGTVGLTYNTGDAVVAVTSAPGTGLATQTTDSSIRSFNENPDDGAPWSNIGDSSSESVGKVFVYERSPLGFYRLNQTITTDTLEDLNDTGLDERIASGDEFGYAMDMNASGDTLVVTSPKADKNLQNQGSAYVFNLESDSYNSAFRLKQKIESFTKYPNEYFGQSVCISPSTDKIVVGASNLRYALPIRFDGRSTTFDDAKTTYSTLAGNHGGVYVFEKKGSRYLLAERLEDDLSLNESFGYSLTCDRNLILVGSPDYVQPTPHNDTLDYTGDKTGMVRLFRKDASVQPFKVIGQETDYVDISRVKRISLYDGQFDTKIQDLEIFDPSKLKILNAAERELSWKTGYNPAVYNVGNEDVTVDTTNAWYEKNVGELWWDLSTVKWINYEQGDTAYRLGNWGQLAEGASVDIYEWVESSILPSEWSVIADTTEGSQLGISGQPLYAEDEAYSAKTFYNPLTGLPTETKYYFWVKNKLIVPENKIGRTISSANVASLITNPGGLGNTYIALADSDKLFLYNYRSIASDDTNILNIEFRNSSDKANPVHNEYQLLTEGDEDSLPTEKLERKWIDSLVGYDTQGNRVPDPDLSEKQRYGISYRPRQSMFIDRRQILGQLISRVNEVLSTKPFSDAINFTRLNSFDPIPSENLYLYDVKVTNIADLSAVGTQRLKRAQLFVNIIDNEVSSIDIIDPGFGYKPQELFDQETPGVYEGPAITITGDGTSAEAICHIDGQGRVVQVVVTNRGKNYTNATATVRNFSVLVENDNTANNYWSIYAWDDERKSFFRSASQGFDTRLYWNFADWWADGYTSADRITKEINDVSQEPTITTEIGDLIKIKEYGSGGWAVFEKTMSDSKLTNLDNYKLVGRKDGTIRLSDDLYNVENSRVGYDNATSFDVDFYDIEPTTELRNILDSIKIDILLNEDRVQWNKLFFNSVRYAFYEQTYIDWAFKTSFLNAEHNIGEFKTTSNYKNDSLDSYLSYIEEVKPYRTSIREYISKYDSIENSFAATTDFDLPPVYNSEKGKIVSVNEFSNEINQYPYAWWNNNKGFEIERIDIASGGSGYTSPPTVVIEGNGSGAEASAYISNGKVTGVIVKNNGKGYTQTPTISLVGGNGSSTDIAKAVAIMGNSLARSLSLSIKFDRLSKDGLYNFFTDSNTFTASGTTAVFDLKYAPTRDKNKIKILKNDQVVLGSEYSISLYKSSDEDFSILKGKIVFEVAPEQGDIIKVDYDKNDELFDSVNRINKFYAPTEGMKGDDLAQLMTGIDYGGVQIQGTTFDVTGGWDALPWFTDSWDSVESSADYYHVCDGSTDFVELPYTPADGQEINIYLKRAGEEVLPTLDNLQYSDGVKSPPIVRIDSPYFLEGDDSSTSPNPTAEMPTFYGDGSTKIVSVGQYLETNNGDILIFRPVESDGSVTITDPNIVDTNLSGGSLETINSSYSTATGMTVDEIKIEGGKFIGPDEVPSPEENIPGQVLDSLSIKVFQTTGSGAAPLHSQVYLGDDSTTAFAINQKILENKSVSVFVDAVKKEQDTDYAVDIVNNNVEFVTAPSANSKIEIISIGIGGVSILDYQEFVADGETSLYLTNASYELTSSVFVTVNNVEVDARFTNSTELVDSAERTLVQFGENPSRNSIIKIVCLGASTDVDSSLQSIVRVNSQTVIHDGSTRSYDLDNFVSLSRESAVSSMIVEVNDIKLRGVDTIYNVYDGNKNSFTLGEDPEESPGATLSRNIAVYINGTKKTFIQDYVFDGTTKILTIEKDILKMGDIIRIENNLRSEYSVEDGNFVINSSVTLAEGDEISVTWFSEYPSMQINSDVVTGGKVNYQLPFAPLGVSYVWVYKNGVKLIQDVDYQISLPRGVIYLNVDNDENDILTINTFGTGVFALPSAYEVHKDMLNVYRFNRYSSVSELALAEDLSYYDESIKLLDVSTLFQPNKQRNIAGIVQIGNERISYFDIDTTNNTISGLRRGIHGTAIAELHSAGEYVVDISKDDSLPYIEEQDRADFVSDGSTILVGPLEYVPAQSSVTSGWYSESIPEDYNRCDIVEVFVGGKRLRKTAIDIFDETIAPVSPSGDKKLEAEFAVDGINPYIRLTKAPTAGTRITVIKRTGNTWYDKGENTASAGVTLLANNSPISRFIAAKTTRLPE